MVETTAEILSQPERNGPDSMHMCTLTCVELCKDCKRTIFEQVHLFSLAFAFLLKLVLLFHLHIFLFYSSALPWRDLLTQNQGV